MISPSNTHCGRATSRRSVMERPPTGRSRKRACHGTSRGHAGLVCAGGPLVSWAARRLRARSTPEHHAARHRQRRGPHSAYHMLPLDNPLHSRLCSLHRCLDDNLADQQSFQRDARQRARQRDGRLSRAGHAGPVPTRPNNNKVIHADNRLARRTDRPTRGRTPARAGRSVLTTAAGRQTGRACRNAGPTRGPS